MAPVVVIAPAGWPVPAGDVRVRRYTTAAEVVAALEAPGDVVLVSDALTRGDLGDVAAAVRARTGETIELRSERWDGATESPLSGACRGVISGFGAAALVRAIEVLRGA